MSESPVVLGLDYGGTKIAAAVSDLTGHLLARATLGSDAGLGARASFGRGVEAARDLLATAAPGSTLAAVGVATFGIPSEDAVELAPAISGWGGLAMGRELRAAFPETPIRMATDAKAAAQAETRWGALAGHDPAVYLNLGTGLAAAIVVGGQVVAGRDGAAGEIGYNLRAVADVGLALEHRTPLEGVVSGQALARLALARQALARRDGTPTAGSTTGPAPAAGGTTGPGPASGSMTPGALTAADVFGATADEPDLDRLVTEFVDELALHVVNLTILLNPAVIAVGGGMVRSWGRIGPRLEHALRAGVPFPPDLVLARFPFDAPLLGAVALAIDAALDGNPAADGGRVTLNLGTMA